MHFYSHAKPGPNASDFLSQLVPGSYDDMMARGPLVSVIDKNAVGYQADRDGFEDLAPGHVDDGQIVG